MTPLATIYLVTRGAILVALAYALLVAATHWAVRGRRLNPFGAWPRFMRRISDPVLHPLERRILRGGGNPQDAPFWLLGLVIAAGLVLLWLVGWIVGLFETLSTVARSGPGAWIYTAVRGIFWLLELALVIRVIGSWIGLGRFNRWTRWAYHLTDWIVEPLRRRLPALGPLDLSPLAAWVLLSWVAEPLVLAGLARVLPGA